MTSLRMFKGKKEDRIKLNSMVLLSFLLHALALSIIFFSPTLPSPRWTFGPVYTVDLVSLPLSVIDKGTRASREDVIGISHEDKSVVIKKKVDKTVPTSFERTKARKKVTTGAVEKAIEDIKKRTLPSQGETAQVTSRGDVEMTMKMRVYYSVIWSRIKSEWVLPEGILSQDNYETIIAVKILRNGTVAEFEFEKKSGNRYFDESAAKAVKKASPFPALPEWLRKSSLEVGIRFRSSELM